MPRGIAADPVQTIIDRMRAKLDKLAERRQRIEKQIADVKALLERIQPSTKAEKK